MKEKFQSMEAYPEMTQVIELVNKDIKTVITVFHVQKVRVKIEHIRDFPGGTVVENPPANAGDTGSSPGPGGSHMLRSN